MVKGYAEQKFLLDEEGKLGKNLVLFSIIIGVVLLSIVGFISGTLNKTNEITKDEGRILSIISFLENSSVKIYGTDKCPYCEKQREDFGDLFPLLIEKGIYVNCSKDAYQCQGITAFPTWAVNSTIIYQGYLSLENKTVP